jgi:hypothetical protein
MENFLLMLACRSPRFCVAIRGVPAGAPGQNLAIIQESKANHEVNSASNTRKSMRNWELAR